MDFTYEVVWPGWARAEIRDGDQVARLTASYLSDALGDLLQGVLRALLGANTVEFVWLEEPGEYRWRLEPTGDVTILSITSTADVRREEGWNDDGWDPDLVDEDGPDALEFRSELDLRGFATVAAAAARAIIAKDGEAGYLHRWIEHPFPMFTLRTVEKLLAESGRA